MGPREINTTTGFWIDSHLSRDVYWADIAHVIHAACVQY